MNNINCSVIKKNNIKYFDYSATTFMPDCVIEKWVEYNSLIGVSINRGSSILSKKSSLELEKSEETIKSFFDLGDYDIIYNKNVTEAINHFAMGIEKIIKPMELIVVGPLEHHSNYLPWIRLAKKTNSLFMEIPLLENGELDYSFIDDNKDNIRIISISAISNSIGYKIDLNEIIKRINDRTILCVDDSQVVGHEKINNNDRIDVHFIPSHKMYGPKNISITFINKRTEKIVEPIVIGGGMVEKVGYETTYLDNINRFKAGTFDVSLVSAFSEACTFLTKKDYLDYSDKIKKYSKCIQRELVKNGYKLIRFDNKCVDYIISFYHPKIHAHDIEEFLNSNGIIIRSGNLCTQNSLRKLEVSAINRISLGLYVTRKDVDFLCEKLKEIAYEYK